MDRIESGDLEAIDRALKIVDRLDRYHGFPRASPAIEQYGEEERARLMPRSTTSPPASSRAKPQNDGRSGDGRRGAAARSRRRASLARGRSGGSAIF